MPSYSEIDRPPGDRLGATRPHCLVRAAAAVRWKQQALSRSNSNLAAHRGTKPRRRAQQAKTMIDPSGAEVKIQADANLFCTGIVLDRTSRNPIHLWVSSPAGYFAI